MKKLLQGNEACALAAIAAGCRFYAGYPITPSSEIAEYMARRLPAIDGTFIQMEDEIASIAACIGASLTGAMAMTATSGPGFSLMQENLGYACLAEIPIVVVDAQRVGPSTGMPTLPSQGDVMQARWGTHGDHPIVVLAPTSVADYYDLTIKAFEISESLRTPVILLADEVVSHLREVVNIPEVEPLHLRRTANGPPESFLPYQTSEADEVPAMGLFGTPYRFHVTGLYHNEDGSPTNDPQKAADLIQRVSQKMYRPELEMVRSYWLKDAELAVVAYGSPVRAALSAVRQARERGIRAGLLQISCVWPFPADVIRKLADTTQALVVPEMNLGQLVGEIKQAAAGEVPVHSLTRAGGELFSPDDILTTLESLAAELGLRHLPDTMASPKSRHEIRLVGTGGQGLILAGIILSEAAGLFDKKKVVQTQVYGPESRGGASRADVIIDDQEIDYPRAAAPEALLVMSQDGYQQFHQVIAPGGILLYDEALVTPRPDDGHAIGFPFTRIAREELGKSIAANMIGLATVVALTQVVSPNALEAAVLKRAPRGTQEVNRAAIQRGFSLAREAQIPHQLLTTFTAITRIS